jgi:hypothetical protein
MKNYLYDFLKKCEYAESDIAFLTDAYEKIASHAEASTLWAQAIGLYRENIRCDFKRILALANRAAELLSVHKYTAELLIFLCLTKYLREEYEKRGLDIAIFENTVLDLRYKTEECKLVKGIVGSFVAEWFFKFFDMTRFALGRLQFQIIALGHTYEKDGVTLTPETKVIDVHIPRSLQPLDEKSCDEAFAQAKAFFADEVGEVCAFVCHSWLLFPEHETILSHGSNVYKFMKRFDIIKSGYSHSKGDLWRLFDTDEKDPEKLPADTSMRRAYVSHLKNGGKTGWGFGAFIL